MRNRKTKSGEWLSKEMKAFMSSKLNESNDELDIKTQKKFNKISKKYKLKYKTKEIVIKIIGKVIKR